MTPPIVRGLIAGLVGFALAGCGRGSVPGLEPGSVYAIDGTVSSGEGSPLSWAAVALEGSPFGTVTGPQGKFGIDGLRNGRYGLVVMYAGFRSRPKEIRVPDGGGDTLILEMIRDARLGPAFADSLSPVQVYYELRGSSR